MVFMEIYSIWFYNMKFDFKTLPVIILAAGDSKRMGMPKGLLDYRGKTFLSFQLELLSEIGFTEIVIVLGKENKLYQEKVPELKDINLVVNPAPERGQFSSIQCGLLALSKSHLLGVFILPVDVPCPDEDVWEQLAKVLSTSDANVSIPEFNGKKGHPVFLSEEFKKYLITCSSDTRLDYEIHRQRDNQKTKIISVNDRNITLNLNTHEAWNAYKVEQ